VTQNQNVAEADMQLVAHIKTTEGGRVQLQRAMHPASSYLSRLGFQEKDRRASTHTRLSFLYFFGVLPPPFFFPSL